MGFSSPLSLLRRCVLCFQFWHYLFFPLLLNAHVATSLYRITKALLINVPGICGERGGKFIVLNSCSSSVPMKLGFFCDHPLLPPSPSYLSLKRHRCLITGEAVSSCTSPRKSLREKRGFTGALLFPVVDCENVLHYPLTTCGKFFPSLSLSVWRLGSVSTFQPTSNSCVPHVTRIFLF